MPITTNIFSFFHRLLQPEKLSEKSPEDEKKEFLATLEQAIKECDKIEISGLGSEQKNQIRTIIKTYLSTFYDELNSNNMTKLAEDKASIRARAGQLLLTSSLFLGLGRQLEQPPFELNAKQKEELKEGIRKIIIAPYKKFTSFEKALHQIPVSAHKNLFNSESKSDENEEPNKPDSRL